MVSLKRLKMNKVFTLLSSKDDVREFRNSLEIKTKYAFAEFAKSRQKSIEMSHRIHLD